MKKTRIGGFDQKNVNFEFNGVGVEVIPFVAYETQKTLISLYINTYFSVNGEDRLGAEAVNRFAVLDLLTNIDISFDESDNTKNIELMELLDNIVASGLWEKVTKSIKNYRELEYNISVAVGSVQKQKSDVGYVIQNFLNVNVLPILETLKGMDFSDDKLSQIKGIVSELGQQLNSSPIKISSVIKNGTL